MTTTHRVVLRKGPSATGTSGHGHRRAMTVDAAGRRISWWSCALANGGPCESESPPKLPPPKPEPDERRREQNREAARRFRERHRAA